MRLVLKTRDDDKIV